MSWLDSSVSSALDESETWSPPFCSPVVALSGASAKFWSVNSWCRLRPLRFVIRLTLSALSGITA